MRASEVDDDAERGDNAAELPAQRRLSTKRRQHLRASKFDDCATISSHSMSPSDSSDRSSSNSPDDSSNSSSSSSSDDDASERLRARKAHVEDRFAWKSELFFKKIIMLKK